MDVAIVTGADSRFGDAVCRTLLKMGFRIHALGQNPDASGYDSRYYIPHSYGPGKLAELKGCLEDALEAEGRLDLLIGLGGPEVTTGWENSSPEGLVRRLHGCLTEPLLAASVCLDALKKSKGFLIHGHRRPVAKDLTVCPGYFEDSMRKAYDDLFVRNAEAGLRSARILYAFPEGEGEGSGIQQDVAESVSRAFEIILRQKETCIVREMNITPRGLGPVGIFPNLVSGMDPYQTTVLPEKDDSDEDPILIPTEKPRHYVQIAEVKDITDGDVEVPDYYEGEGPDEEDDQSNRSGDGNQSGKRRRPSRSRSRSRNRPKPKDGQADNNPDDGGKPAETSGEKPKNKERSRPREEKSSQKEKTPEANDRNDDSAPPKGPARKSARKRTRRPSRKPKSDNSEPRKDPPANSETPSD